MTKNYLYIRSSALEFFIFPPQFYHWHQHDYYAAMTGIVVLILI